MIDVRQLGGALDLWLCMWEPEEKERFETAVVRAMTDENDRPIRRLALALCHVLATPRLCTTAARARAAGVFDGDEVRLVEVVAGPLRALLAAGQRLRGDLNGVERLLARYVDDADDRAADALLDWVDVRDLVAVARTTLDGRLFGEIERRIARRGKYQRGRAANLLGFEVRNRFASAGESLFQQGLSAAREHASGELRGR